MSLIGALNIGKSALAAHQAAIQVSSNNIANAGDPNYTRQVARVTTNGDQQIRPGIFMGTGVNLTSIERQIDQALETRIRSSLSDTGLAGTRQQFLSRVESIFNELGDDDLSSQLSVFFNSWSQLSNQPEDLGFRQIVLESGSALSNTFRQIGSEFTKLQTDVNARMASLTRDANSLLDQVADLNQQIVTAEAGRVGGANNLRDQRDAVLKELSGLVDIYASETPEGVVNVSIGSDVIVLNTTNRGISYQNATVDGQLTGQVISASDGRVLDIDSGQIGGLISLSEDIAARSDDIDALAGQLIFELNKMHSSGQGLSGFSQLTAANQVTDATAALNTAASGLDFAPKNGSFVVHVKSKSTGATSSMLVQVDLDGLNADDTTLNSLLADIDGITGVAATVTAGRLSIAGDSTDVEISFSQDSSGVLAALGLNGFFTGSDARDIAVSASLKSNPALLAAAKNGQKGDNQTAVAIASLETLSLAGLGNLSLKDKYEAMINTVAVSAASAQTSSEAATAVQETLLTQRESLSGVSLDEEAINLMREQRAFQGAARVVSAVDELMRTILDMV
jgi:flagellar hook-associated protein 1 FlgK